ncbi:MAG TPA: hypothetical protein V6C52_08150 [Coleofasciculaceae cyanobacterium]
MGDRILNGKRYVEWSRSRGQSLVEYAMIGALVVLVAIGALNLLGQSIQGQFTVMAADMGSNNPGIALSAPPGSTSTATAPAPTVTPTTTASTPTSTAPAPDPTITTSPTPVGADPAPVVADTPITTSTPTNEPAPVATSDGQCNMGGITVGGICQQSVDGW